MKVYRKFRSNKGGEIMKQIYYKVLENGNTEFQDAPYIEDGCYIVNKNGMFEVWEIPLGGGKEQLHKVC